jgi:HD-like signal output (HDOD) protein
MTQALQDEPAPPSSRETVRQAIGRLGDLPCSLPVIQKAIAAMDDPDCSNDWLESILTADQGITTRLLRLANSAYFGVSRKVSTLSMAVALIGYGRVQTILWHIIVAKVFALLSAKSAAASRIWKVAIAAGAASRATAQAGWVGDPEELLTLGLLHNTGDLALLCQFPEEFLTAEDPGSATSGSALRSVFGVDSGTAGQWLLDGWLFPAIFGTACRYWPDPLSTAVGECDRAPVAAVHVGVGLARSWIDEIDAESAARGLSPEAVELLDLDNEAIAEIYANIKENVSEVRDLLELV